MKKIASLIAILLLVIAGIWIYKANKFEQFVNERFIPLLKRSEATFITDINSIIVEKFKFKVKLKNVIAFPNSESFATKTDNMDICYDPLTDKITLFLNAGKVSIGTGDNEIYILSKEQTVTINQQLFKHGLDTMFDDMYITFTANKPFVYLAKNDMLIASSKSSYLQVTSKLNKDAYSINFATNNDQLKINPEARYSKNILDELIPKSELAAVNSSSYLQYYYKMIDQTGPSDFVGKYSFDLKEEYLKNAISALLDKKNNIEKLFELLLAFTQEDYSLHAKEKLTNKSLDHSWSIDIEGKDGKVNTDFKLACLSNYIKEQKQGIISITQDLILKNLSELDFNITKEDTLTLAETITNVDKLKLEFNFTHDIKTENSDNSLKVEMNDFSAKFEGEIADKIYQLSTEINTPSQLVNGIGTLYEKGLMPILSKNTNQELEPKIKSFNKLMENVKENGFDALAAFHKNGSLEKNKTLEADIVVNLQNFEFKINDKGVLDILTDENIIKFLQGMPKNEEKN